VSDRDYDIIVVGGGMIGCAFAAALKNTPLSVALLDAGEPPIAPPTDRYDLRVSAISPGTRAILGATGGWQRLQMDRVGPYQAMGVWDACSSGAIRFDAAELGEAWLGYIIENINIQQALMGAIEAASNIHCRFGVSPGHVDADPDHCRMVLESGETLSARLIVGADGARSWVRDALGIGLDTRLYGERAFVCEVRTAEPHRQTAWQRFLPTGPVAFLPLANGDCSVVWTCDAGLADELGALEREAFRDRLQEAFDARLGEVEIVSAVQSFDLSRRRAERYVVERGALIGDAAHVVHPLAGQGANLGFGDAWSLARVVLDAEQAERDFGGRHVLRRYERWRRSENFAMMRMLDALHSLFLSEWGIVRGARGVGLNLVDRQGWLKQFFARQAIGGAVSGTERPVAGP